LRAAKKKLAAATAAADDAAAATAVATELRERDVSAIHATALAVVAADAASRADDCAAQLARSQTEIDALTAALARSQTNIDTLTATLVARDDALAAARRAVAAAIAAADVAVAEKGVAVAERKEALANARRLHHVIDERRRFDDECDDLSSLVDTVAFGAANSGALASAQKELAMMSPASSTTSPSSSLVNSTKGRHVSRSTRSLPFATPLLTTVSTDGTSSQPSPASVNTAVVCKDESALKASSSNAHVSVHAAREHVVDANGGVASKHVDANGDTASRVARLEAQLATVTQQLNALPTVTVTTTAADAPRPSASTSTKSASALMEMENVHPNIAARVTTTVPPLFASPANVKRTLLVAARRPDIKQLCSSNASTAAAAASFHHHRRNNTAIGCTPTRSSKRTPLKGRTKSKRGMQYGNNNGNGSGSGSGGGGGSCSGMQTISIATPLGFRDAWKARLLRSPLSSIR
jgi:hypothetical protein